MTHKYLIQIFTKPLQTKFEIEVEKEINAVEELHPHIIDFLGKNDIKWESLGEMHDPRTNRITYEEVIEDGKTSAGPLSTEEGSGPRMGAGSSQGG